MSFHKRFLSEDSINNHAKYGNFESFQTYMTNADAYMINGNMASKFYQEFGQCEPDSQERKDLYTKIINNEYQ